MIKSFNREEKKALVAILKFIASADGNITDEEIEKFNKIADEKGFEDFTEIFAEVDKEVHSMDDLKFLIHKVREQTHEQDILRYAVDIARSDGEIIPGEVEVLKIMGDEWDIDISVL